MQATPERLDYFIFDPKQHDHFVDDFLIKASRAHKHEKRSRDWFYWKFFANPYGDSILACVATKTELVGCVAYGKQPFQIDGEKYEGVLSFETFVDPAFQGRGLFSKLIKFAEEEVKRQGVKIMLNFPNSQSLRGFIKKNWQPLPISAYYLRPRLSFNLLRNFSKIRTPFVPLASNLEVIKDQFPKQFNYKYKASHEPVVTADYINYRFFSFPNAHYLVYNENDTFAVGRLGKRAELTELQILVFNSPELSKKSMRAMLRYFKTQTKADLISYPSSVNSVLRGLLKKLGFIKVPNKANVCYKILDENINPDMNKLELSAINFHTY
jgi:GNAT superfamily N-acetyltransferase